MMENSKGDWIVFTLTYQDFVQYMTPDIDYPRSLDYIDFIHFINKFKPINYNKLIESINSYKTIILYTEYGEWEEKIILVNRDITFDELSQLNRDKLFYKDCSINDEDTGYDLNNVFRKFKNMIKW